MSNGNILNRTDFLGIERLLVMVIIIHAFDGGVRMTCRLVNLQKRED